MKPRLPDYREKQKLIYIDNSPKEVLITYGDRCRSADRIFDALEYYQKAKHKPGLREIVDAAISSGDAMLLEQAAKALGTSPTVGEWDRLGRRPWP